jgi:hypothetical protein
MIIKQKALKKAINIWKGHYRHIALGVTITAAYADDVSLVCEVTQLIDNSFTRRDVVWVTMHVKTIYDGNIMKYNYITFVALFIPYGKIKRFNIGKT